MRAKIVLLVLGAVAVMAVCSGLFIVQTRANIQAEVFRNQSALAHTYAGLVDQFLDSARGSVESVAALPEVRLPLDSPLRAPEIHGIPADAEPARRGEMAASQAPSHLDGVLLITPAGEPYAMEPYESQAGFRDDTVADLDWFKSLTLTGQTTWSDVFSANLGHGETPAVVVAVPIKTETGELRSVLSAAISLDGLSVDAQKIHIGETGQLMLFDSQGVPIVYPDPALVEGMAPLVDHPLISAALAGHAESHAYHNPLSGQDELGTAVKLNNGWFAVVTQSQGEAFDGLNRTMSSLLVVLAVGVAILLGAGLLLADTMARGIGAVSTAAKGLASGDLDQEVDVWSRDEVGRMAASFREMIAYHQRMAGIADAVAGGILTTEVQPQSSRDRLGMALKGMTNNLRGLVGRLEQLAFHDPLTGLANRALFLDKLHAALKRSEQETVGLLFLDVDNFKVVNDSIGHAAGDDLLAEVALRLQRCVGQTAMVSRLGGDEFTILVTERADIGIATATAERIATHFKAPVHVAGHSLTITVSIGIAMGSPGLVTPGELLRAADLALYVAKDAGKARAVIFNPSMDAESQERLDRAFVSRRNVRAA